jgi:histidine ammonia-lyase
VTISLDGGSPTVEKLVRSARKGEKVELDPAAVERIRVCRAMLEDKIKAREVIRRHVDHLDVDRPLYPDHNTMAALVASGEILDAVEAAVGPLD